MSKVIVIGAGAAGMMAAGQAAKLGHEVEIFEKNNILGKKIYITGKGRCNLTNIGDVEEFIENIPGNPYFMYSALYQMDSAKTIEFFESLGLKTKVERGGRVFPISDKASDVADALEQFMRKNKVKIHLNCEVSSIIAEDNIIKGIKLKNNNKVFADNIIVATGGLSYPACGSTGDGYKMASAIGHSITKLRPSLVPLTAKESWCSRLMGLSLKNISIAIKNNKKVLYKDFGEMLFTHYGVSGPVILSASRHILDNIGRNENLTLFIDLKPALDEKTLDQRILRDFKKYLNKDFKNALDDLLPQKIIPVIIELSEIEPDKKVHDITKEQRKKLLQIIKALPLSITGTRGYNEAVITSGGICIDEINPQNMQSKLIEGLYFVGEVLDVDGYTGGFNLQIAFSTAYSAALSLK